MGPRGAWADLQQRTGTEHWHEARRSRELLRKRSAWAKLVNPRSPVLRRDLEWFESADAAVTMVPLLLRQLELSTQHGGEDSEHIKDLYTSWDHPIANGITQTIHDHSIVWTFELERSYVLVSSRPLLLLWDLPIDTILKHGMHLTIQCGDSSTTYERQFFVISLSGTDEKGYTTGHSIVCFQCNQRCYVYDSNRNMPLQFDWASRPMSDLLALTNFMGAFMTPVINFTSVTLDAVVYCMSNAAPLQLGGRRSRSSRQPRRKS